MRDVDETAARLDSFVKDTQAVADDMAGDGIIAVVVGLSRPTGADSVQMVIFPRSIDEKTIAAVWLAAGQRVKENAMISAAMRGVKKGEA